jgi:hypothetical protein
MEFDLFFKVLSSAPAEKIGLTIRFFFVLIEDVHFVRQLTDRCPLSESSGVERHLNQNLIQYGLLIVFRDPSALSQNK